ncbi:LCP family protein [Oscillochloris sp. ZM17-4]|uniref:LCP family protein n=1 Tax=Oscillochloris sp. ZM17-4 TaxID=2866714 RepID=UPI001C72BD5C|nr:LCP family protein [Oscillochloris sp. ZM17-4]MBX0328988.1 LCP family protein [Oscillochloris sp. ZM17-4]
MNQSPSGRRGAYTGETMAVGRRQPGRRPGTIWRRVKLGLALALAAALVGAALLYWQVHRLAAAITVPEVRPNPTLATPLVGANLLLIGVDARPDHPEEGVRSDTLILARLDAAGRWVSLLSIPRDTQVELPDVGTTKINVAYGQGFARAAELYGPDTSPEQGGMALAAQTVERFLDLRRHGMRVDYTAQVNFDGFAGVIDALGGVTVDVPTLIVDDEYPTPDFGTMRVEFQPGPQRMDGARALIYARTRHADSDFGRAERQQQVLRAILHEFQSKGGPAQVAAVPALLASVAGEGGATPPVLTTMPIDRLDVLLGLMSLAGGLDPDSIGQLRISPDVVGLTENGSNLIWNAEDIQALLDTFAAPPSEGREGATVQVLNGTGTPGLARTVSLELEGAGFRILVPDNAPEGSYPRTTVYDTTGKPATSRRLAKTLHASTVRGAAPGVLSQADIVVILGGYPSSSGRRSPKPPPTVIGTTVTLLFGRPRMRATSSRTPNWPWVAV